MFRLSDRLTLIPVVHGSADMARSLVDRMLVHRADVLAVPLPDHWVDDVQDRLEQLPALGAVVEESADGSRATFVPIEPCQPVIAAMRAARAGRLPVRGFDWNTERYEPTFMTFPDPFALRGLSLEAFAAAVLPSLVRPANDSFQFHRVRQMAFELHRLELDFEQVLGVVSLVDWPWVREAYQERLEYPGQEEMNTSLTSYAVDPATAYFFLDELPFVAALFERARRTLDSTESLSIDGVKELLLVARERWTSKRKSQAAWVTPKLLQAFLHYVRNLTLVRGRLSPDLYTLVVAGQQIVGDRFAWSVLNTARDYAIEYAPIEGLPILRMGLGEATLDGEGPVPMQTRLPGVAKQWKSLQLHPDPPEIPPKQKQSLRWDPYQECSWPPEDQKVESFHNHVREQARLMLSADLARSEKFTTSIKDGLDIRETLRHWHDGDLYVREIPPARGDVEVVVFLFDVPSPIDRYPWRTTWMAEHGEESTICFFATDYKQDIVGPAVGRARYGGVMFIYPPRFVPNVWTDSRLDAQAAPDEGLEDRLIRAALFHSTSRHVVVVSPVSVRTRWRRMARQYKKLIVSIPLSRFSSRTVDAVRTLHVLGGKHVRSYAARFVQGD